MAPPLFGALVERAGVTPVFGPVAELALVGVGPTRSLRPHARTAATAATTDD